jgi:urease accessory protein
LDLWSGRRPLLYASDHAGLERFDAQGAIEFSGDRAELAVLRQQAPIRFLNPYPEVGDPRTAVLVNTAGGIVGGDRLRTHVGARDGAQVLVTGQAAEKIYRSDGGTADLTVTLESRSGAALEFLPQGTILFDGARLRRRTVLRVDSDASMLFGEILHFGRAAMGERFSRGEIHDRLDVEWEHRRVWVDALALSEDEIGAMRGLSGLAGAVHAAVLVLVTPSPERFLKPLRACVETASEPGVRSGVAIFDNGPLVSRWLGDDAQALRRSFAAAWCHLRSGTLGRPARMPRIWTI